MSETPIPDKAIELAHEAELLAGGGYPAITSQSDYERAAATRKEAKTKQAQLEKAQAEMIDPLNEAKNKIWAFFKPPLAAIKKFVEEIDRPMSAFVLAEKRRVEEERKALSEIMEDTGETELAMAVLSAPVVVAKAAGTSTRTVAEITVTDKMALLAAIVAGTVDHRCADINQAEVRRWVMVHGCAPAGVVVSEKVVIVNR